MRPAPTSSTVIAVTGVLLGAVMATMTIGLFVQAPWALGVWPWEIKRLSAIFLSSICAAIGAPVIWIGLTRNRAAMFGGSVNLAVASGGCAAAVFMSTRNEAQTRFAWVSLVFCVVCVAMASWSFWSQFEDNRPTPKVVRWSFAAFAVVLLIVGGSLVTNAAPMFPWPLKPLQNALYGWIFLGAATYFLYGAVRPVWGNAVGQLLGFLAYDVVLIVPYLQHFETVPPHLHRNLVVYVAVLVFSGLLAVWYLFVHPATRFGSSATGSNPKTSTSTP